MPHAEGSFVLPGYTRWVSWPTMTATDEQRADIARYLDNARVSMGLSDNFFLPGGREYRFSIGRDEPTMSYVARVLSENGFRRSGDASGYVQGSPPGAEWYAVLSMPSRSYRLMWSHFSRNMLDTWQHALQKLFPNSDYEGGPDAC